MAWPREVLRNFAESNTAKTATVLLGMVPLWLHQNPAHSPAANVPQAACMNPIYVTPATEEKRKRNNFIATPAKLVPQKPRNSSVTNVSPIPIMFIVTQCLIMSCCTLTVSLSTTKSKWPKGPG